MGKLLDWLEGQPGETWQDRWFASGADCAGFEWTDLPLQGRGTPKSHWRDELTMGLVLLVAGQAIRPSYPWLLRQRVTVMLTESRAASDPDDFQRLEQLAQHATATARSDALNKLTWIVIRKGGLVSDITVGDCIELTAALEEHHFRASAGRAAVLCPAQGDRRAPAQRTAAAAGASHRGPPQRRADRRRVRHRVPGRP
ncbi:DNA integrase/recombinase [Streptomyces sp. NPDC005141]